MLLVSNTNNSNNKSVKRKTTHLFLNIVCISRGSNRCANDILCPEIFTAIAVAAANEDDNDDAMNFVFRKSIWQNCVFKLHMTCINFQIYPSYFNGNLGNFVLRSFKHIHTSKWWDCENMSQVNQKKTNNIVWTKDEK